MQVLHYTIQSVTLLGVFLHFLQFLIFHKFKVNPIIANSRTSS